MTVPRLSIRPPRRVPAGYRLFVRRRGFANWEAELRPENGIGDVYRTFWGLGFTRSLAIRDVLKEHRVKTSPWREVRR